ncbi:RagB/SusD family nutrient uptake outer membrane protein [Parapedobacter sp. DT-150]|uniref:RagB/SusD family nutrient uptake outer membrane protein n=1 Tax=Parapedobacter sp. DT-150 TaxID=3396162 RepID=UPI003F1A37CF
MKTIKLFSLTVALAMVASCNYLDVVPDNIATIDNAFNSRAEAEKFLFTCYSFLPKDDHPEANPGFNAGDEFWIYWPIHIPDRYALDPYNIARGLQNKVNVNLNYWDGGFVPSLWQGIRNCNIFLENIDRVPDLDPYMKDRWRAEAIFLKAYYHWCLFRMYGPIPIIDVNLPISATTDEVRVKRQPVDSVVNYIAGLIDQVTVGEHQDALPSVITNEAIELGRITRPAALAIKARVLVTAASPLFNGNQDFANFNNKDGVPLFNTTPDPTKWAMAAEACRIAIEACHAANIELYEFNAGVMEVNEATETEMSIRNAICEPWNSELIWGYTYSGAGDPLLPSKLLQLYTCPQLDPNNISLNLRGQMVPTLKMAELFYTRNGVPIEEDKDWDYSNRYNLRTTTAADSAMQTGYTTVELHFDREPRFYADLAFDGAKFFMKNGVWPIQNKSGQTSGIKQSRLYSITGYYAKKLINWNLIPYTGGFVAMELYPWPVMRLADLYLLYAEALNESGQSAEAIPYLNLIRERAGLPTVETSWTNHAKNPGKYTNQAGLRAIIQRERLIEMAFEGSRFWDLRRWKEAVTTLNQPIYGWDVLGEDYATYNRKVLLFDQRFVSPRDYLWPIADNSITVNPNLVQNPGW